MNKKVIIGNEGKTSMLKGVNTLSDAVKVTLGAMGRNVVIRENGTPPHITKDGVTVAKSIKLKDESQDIGASLVKGIALKTVDEAGDGTTTSIVLAQTLINLGIEKVKNGGNPVTIKKEIESATEEAISYINGVSKIITDNNELVNIATISANGDRAIGELIASAVSKVGKNGLITVNETQNSETSISITEGMLIERGYVSPHFITNPNKGIVEMQSPYILLYGGKLSTINQILPILEMISRNNSEILIIADEIEGEALAALVINKINGKLRACAVKCPDFGANKNAIMEDIATLTGGVYISSEKGLSLDNISLDSLGTSYKVEVTRDSCSLISDGATKDSVDVRCKEIESLIDGCTNEYEKERLIKRLSKLKNGAAVINIGGITELEIKEKKDRIDDALCATKSAIEEGFVAGGGITYIMAAENIKTDNIGANILKEALKSPFRQILSNAGLDSDKYIINAKTGLGVDVYNGVWNCNMINAGIIDPTKVLRVALENAVSVSTLFLTTECIIADDNEN